jgi:hypothetical protein
MPSKDLFEPGDAFNVYSIDEPFGGRDGPIQCFLATDTRTGRQVKLHCLDRRPRENTPERVERFQTTVARLRALDVPALAALYDGGVADRVYWAATEPSIGGMTLGSLLGDPAQRISASVCLMIVSQLASSLRAARDAGVLHLRLHPDRILVHPSRLGMDKLQDIGLAELFSLSPAIMRSDPLYRAPEQLRDGGKAADERADIYGLGMILYAMLAWNPPFADKDGGLPGRDKLLLLAMTQTPPLLGERNLLVPDFLDVFVQSMIAKTRANRPPSWEAVGSQLNEVFERYGVWCNTMNELGALEPAKAQALLTALQGPALLREGYELSGEKPSKPQSGERPSAALRAGVEGYRAGEDGESDHGTSEPEWVAALPEERDEQDEREAGAMQLKSELPEAPAPLAADEQARNASLDPTARPVPDATTHDRISPARVTLPSGRLAPLNADILRPTRFLWAALVVAVLGIGALASSIVVLRSAAPRPPLARSAGLHAVRLPLILPVQSEATPRAPEPSVPPARPSARREPRRPAAPPAATQPPIKAPTSSPAAGEVDCTTFHCLREP